jgi:Tat protein secretion system quality control protein TatD with DNase activity
LKQVCKRESKVKDGPFMSPIEGLKRNESCYLPFVLKEIAAIYEMDQEKVGNAITKTTFEFFGIN